MAANAAVFPPFTYAANLAMRIAHGLRGDVVLREKAGVFTVHGNLSLAHADVETSRDAKCVIAVTPRWHEGCPPEVTCLEPWVRTGADWHVYSDHKLCWCLAHEWRDRILRWGQRHPPAVLADAAKFWCLYAARWLLYRHLLADQLRLTEWPQDWKAWSHGLRGVEEYRALVRRRGRHGE